MIINGLKVVAGSTAWWDGSVEEVASWLDTLESIGLKHVDTAPSYAQAETLLGQAGVASRGFTIDTKLAGAFSPEPATADQVLKSGKESLEKLKTDSVSVPHLVACR